MTTLAPDRRVNAYRDDLADVSLKGRIEAPAYAQGESRHLAGESAPMRRAPRHDAELDTEILYGERVTVFDESEGWAWAQAENDDYVGYLPADDLVSNSKTATHRIAALRTYRYPAPDMKVPPLGLLHLNSRVVAVSAEGNFAQLDDGSFVVTSHLAPLGRFEQDFVAVAERFTGVPYLWGGRTSTGLDCSALVQLSLQASGQDCPRDSDMQEEGIGAQIADGWAPDVQVKRGDLIFWKGHVGVMLDGERLLHANMHHMATAIEPLREAVARIDQTGSPVTCIRRIILTAGKA